LTEEEAGPAFDDSMADLFEEKLGLGFRVLSRSPGGKKLEFEVEPLSTHEESFGKVLEEFIGSSYRPVYRQDGERLTIAITQLKRKKRKFRPYLHLGLIAATAITMTGAGYLWWAEGDIAGSLMFAFALMSILGVHELGHALVARRRGIEATLPFFIPAPPQFPFGTFGALIFMDSPITNRKSLLDVGMAGPIAGFLLSIPFLLIGLKFSQVLPISDMPTESGDYIFGMPLLLLYLAKLFTGFSEAMYIEPHPVAMAGWAGLFVTSLNLLPMGQLDGGHIIRGIMPRHFRKVYYLSALLLLFLGLFWPGWFLWALIATVMTRLDHPGPLDDVSTLDSRRWALVLLVLAILILSFIPIPVVPADILANVTAG